ncbi:MAG: hypothetical protein ABI127_09070 [Dokdonella sp.]
MSPIPQIASLVLLTTGILATLPAQADDDRFTLRLGAIQVDGNAHVNAAVDLPGNGYSYSSGRIDFGKRTVPRVEGVFRFSERNRLLFNYFSYDNDDRYALTDDLVVGGNTLPAGTMAVAKAQFDLGSLVYDYALIETPTVSVGAQIGAAWADLKGSISVGSQDIQVRSSENVNGAAPVVGVRLSTITADHKWGFTAQAQYLNARWGSFEPYGGNISRANALVEYRFTNTLGIYGGYDWFRLKADRTRNNDDVGFDLRYMGPTAGLTLAF